MLVDPKAVWSEAFLHYHAWLYYTKTVDLIAEASMNDQTREAARLAALRYHASPKPGKLEIRATKPLANQIDLARAYSPGVAEACKEIQADPSEAATYTSRANLVAAGHQCLPPLD